MIGEIIGNRYRILRELGRGGMAQVYLAEDLNEAHLVAVKILYSQFGSDPTYIQRFIREAQLAEALDVPQVVKTRDYGASRDTYYLVMDYVEGVDLDDHLHDRKRLPWEEALQLIDQVCLALEAAHAHGIVHRDIKPQNIMLTDQGEVKVLDFGIAQAQMLPSLTQTGFIGSPYSIAPEQALGEEIDIRADIYSTGILLYQLIAGKVPFDGNSPWAIIQQHISDDIPDLAQVADVPLGVQQLFAGMVAKQPKDRFQTPGQVHQAIAAVLSGNTIEISATATQNLNQAKRAAIAYELFQQAEAALEEEDWTEAVSLLTQTLQFDPNHPNAKEKLNAAGTKGRLQALYIAASQALAASRWQEAINQFSEIQAVNPDYRDVAERLAKAQEGLTHQDSQLRLARFFDEALAFWQADQPAQAEQRYRRIRAAADDPEAVDKIWAEVQKAAAALSQEAKQRQPQSEANNATEYSNTSLSQARWLAITAVLVLIIVAAVLYVSQNPPAALTETPSTDQLAQAQAAFEAGDVGTAEALVNAALDDNPENETALALQAELVELDARNTQLAAAFSAVAARDWNTALGLLEPLAESRDFQPDTVNSLLCDTYLSRGQERLDSITTARDAATVRAARRDFQAGQQICPDRPELQTQFDLATLYLAGLDQSANIDARIEALDALRKTQPDYANRQVQETLYRAYLARGEIQENAGSLRSALTDYQAARELDVASTDQARLSEFRVRQALSQISVIETVITPTQTVPTPVPGNFQYAAPKLTGPAPFAEFAGQFTEIILSWEPVGLLAADEYYDVTIRYFVGEEPRYWGSGPLTEISWRVPIEAGYGVAGRDEFTWWVTVRQANTGTNSEIDRALSPPSEERIFFWRPQ